MQQRLPSLLDPPIGFAHRGARAHAPENTVEAFELALKLGATGVETDAWLTADGVVVLDHDGVVRKGLFRRNIAELRRAELPSHIPTLGDLLERCGPEVHVSIDCKDAAVGRAIVEQLRVEFPDRLATTWLCHPDWRVVAALRPLSDEIRLVDSTRLRVIKEGPERRAATLREVGVDAVNLHHTDWSGGLTTLFHRFDRLAFAWDLQHEHLLRTALRMGVDAVFSDWVDRMVEALDTF